MHQNETENMCRDFIRDCYFNNIYHFQDTFNLIMRLQGKTVISCVLGRTGSHLKLAKKLFRSSAIEDGVIAESHSQQIL